MPRCTHLLHHLQRTQGWLLVHTQIVLHQVRANRDPPCVCRLQAHWAQQHCGVACHTSPTICDVAPFQCVDTHCSATQPSSCCECDSLPSLLGTDQQSLLEMLTYLLAGLLVYVQVQAAVGAAHCGLPLNPAAAHSALQQVCAATGASERSVGEAQG